MENKSFKIVIIGAGAAGVFAAIRAKELLSDSEVIILEKTRQPLAKVKISGGGRCNVTHSCFDPKELSKNYPRGQDALRQLFYTFQPQDMIDWLKKRSVSVKVESDGRMFPVSNSSSTIIDCFLSEIKSLGVKLMLEKEVVRIEKKEEGFFLFFKDDSYLFADKVLFATGGSTKAYTLCKELGHTISDPVPSLFTFNIKDSRLEGLSGLSVPSASVYLDDGQIKAKGPLLITHWGLSGPAILKVSAFGARILSEKKYTANLFVNWLGDLSETDVKEGLDRARTEFGSKPVLQTPLWSLPKNLWRRLLEHAGIIESKVFSQLSKQEMQSIIKELSSCCFAIEGKSTNKDEFVTCGGVPWREIDPKTMQSKLVKGLYFAGEVVDSDGITGGFNFQNAWTTAWIAAHAMAGVKP